MLCWVHTHQVVTSEDAHAQSDALAPAHEPPLGGYPPQLPEHMQITRSCTLTVLESLIQALGTAHSPSPADGKQDKCHLYSEVLGPLHAPYRFGVSTTSSGKASSPGPSTNEKTIQEHSVEVLWASACTLVRTLYDYKFRQERIGYQL